MSEQNDLEDYVELLTHCQSSLYAYIFSLTGNSSDARDILQETNRKLWKLHAEYDPGRDFMPWAITVAYNQVRAAWKTRSRERLVFQEYETLQALAEEQDACLPNMGEYLFALEVCLGKLESDQRRMIEGYYRDGHPLVELAQALKLRANTIAVRLHRIRNALADCVRRAME